MEYIEGKTLDELIPDRGLRVAEGPQVRHPNRRRVGESTQRRQPLSGLEALEFDGHRGCSHKNPGLIDLPVDDRRDVEGDGDE
jgi:hypothetical protein